MRSVRRGKGLMTESTWCAKQLCWRSMHFSVAFSISSTRFGICQQDGCTERFAFFIPLCLRCSRSLSLIHTPLHAFGFLNIIHRITLVLKLTVASSHGICGARTKWRKKAPPQRAHPKVIRHLQHSCRRIFPLWLLCDDIHFHFFFSGTFYLCWFFSPFAFLRFFHIYWWKLNFNILWMWLSTLRW